MATAPRAEARYVSSCRSDWGRHAATVYPTFAGTFHRATVALGFTDTEVVRGDPGPDARPFSVISPSRCAWVRSDLHSGR